jgi:hypothetical protein
MENIIVSSKLKNYSSFICRVLALIQDQHPLAMCLVSKNRFQSNWYKLFLNEDKFILYKVVPLIVHVVKEMVKVLRARNVNIQSISSETLILSFIYSRNISNDKCTDPYFGKLAVYLEGSSSVSTIFRPLSCDLKLNKSRFKGSYSVYNFLKFRDIFLILINYLKVCRILFMKVSAEDKEVKTLLLNELLNPSTITSLIYYELGRKISTNRNIIRTVYTYENNSWEQGLLLGLNGKSKSIGYVHTIIPECAANMFISEDEIKLMPLPDKVLTLGAIPKSLIDTYSNSNISVDIACALRFEYIFDAKNLGEKQESPKGEKILIGLEGVMESVKVLDICLDAASLFPEKNFIIRCHPALGIDVLSKHLKSPKLLEVLNNIEVSINKSLEEDLNAASCLIYWGSTIGVEALFKGLPVIHVDLGAELSYDPLFFWDDLAYTAKSSSALIEAIKNIQNMKENDYKMSMAKVDELRNMYFSMVTPNSIDKFLQ